jgi:predicted ATP-dependent endonuclease of OLD family
MRYTAFKINDYKAIEGELVVNLSKSQLLPIIGVNESGKTSILGAIFAFDRQNDTLNQGRHLLNVANLNKTTEQGTPRVTAIIEISSDEVAEMCEHLGAQEGLSEAAVAELKKYKSLLKPGGEIVVTRHLEDKSYIIEGDCSKLQNINPLVIEYLLTKAPYILYFDDFRDTIEEELEIPSDNSEQKGWLQFIEQLFKRTDSSYSVFKLKDTSELIRTSILGDIRSSLNATISQEWEKFTITEENKLEVEIKYLEKDGRPFLQLLVKEKVSGRDRYFGIRDRSKGFYWFFNFVMKLEFNPKVRGMEDKDTIYLLDEPGSYLHPAAQAKLCDKLSALSESNTVIYCTHSHYLLDPDKVPLNLVRVAQRTEGNIVLTPLLEYKDETREKRLAIQPIIDALQIKPFLTDLNFKNICIVEGMYDYYVFEMFKGETDVKFLPSVGAASIKYFISIAIAWGLNYAALWDNDEEGNRERQLASNFFGQKEAQKFMSLPLFGRKKSSILQDLFEGDDIGKIKALLGISNNSSFEKMVATLFFHKNREVILGKVSEATQQRISQVLSLISQG